MPHDTLLIAVMVLPFVGSFAAALFPANARNAEAWLAGGIALAGLIMVSVIYPAVTGGGVIRRELRWLPDLGLNFVLRMDGFSWMFSV
jgi:multicomponent K+:H+ antiporter subunit A